MILIVSARECLLLRCSGREEGAELRCLSCEFVFGRYYRIKYRIGDDVYVKRLGHSFFMYPLYIYLSLVGNHIEVG